MNLHKCRRTPARLSLLLLLRSCPMLPHSRLLSAPGGNRSAGEYYRRGLQDARGPEAEAARLLAAGVGRFRFGAAMGMSVWLVLKRRNRKWAVALSIGSLAYFGFYREGCICPIGSIQNVAVALTIPSIPSPWW